ncbi:MAG: hypothetical protein EPO35_00235 [Acidobacteria bacterium]|nr:MAG: hypothetical protein EPO35_00235 [Acidobacteriota bacterium]
MGLGLPELLILFVLVFGCGVVLIWPAARICKRAGFSPWLGILIIVPIANVVLLWYVAFSPWPAVTEFTKNG